MQNQIPFSNYPQNFNRTMQIVEPTYSQHIMKAPELNVTNGRIPQVLVIDSNDRDCRKYFKPNDYTYQLNKEYKNVVSIELVQACIPYTGYAINENNNRLFIQETFGETVEVVIPIGNYDVDILMKQIIIALNKPPLSSTYTITANSILQKFTITSDLSGGDHIFRFLNNNCPCGQNAPNDEHNSFVNGHNISCNDCDSCELCHKNNCQEYLKGSISKKLGFGKVNYLFASGTITSFKFFKGGIGIFACNSKFTSEFKTGEAISFSNLMGVLFTVSTIVSDTEMIILPKDDGGIFPGDGEIFPGGGEIFPGDGEGGPIKSGIGFKIEDLICSKIFANKYTSDSVWDLEDAKYIILDIDHLENIDSNNKNIDDSYAVIFFTTPHGEDNILSTGSTPRKGIKKYFNPPLSTLDRLRIKFITADGELYDFNGRNHVLMFEIIALNQPGKYSTLVTN
jgi:hypothetical protein